MAALEIRQIPVLKDNYVYLLREPDSGAVGAVDPSVAAPVLEALSRLDWKLTHILNTHHHNDHTGGNLELKGATGCIVVGPLADRARIPGIDVAVGDGDNLNFGKAVADRNVDAGDPGAIGQRPDDDAAGGALQFEIAAGVIGMVMRVEDMRQLQV